MAYNTIKLKKYVDHIEEFVANAAITPGMLIELMSTNKVRAHATADGAVTPKMFALEDELQGNGIADAYSADNPVQCWVCVPGEQVYALLADGENASIGEKLVSNGNGYLKCASGDSGTEEAFVAIAMEAVDRSGSSGEDTNVTGRIRVMVV